MPGHGKSRPKNTTIPLDALKWRYGNAGNLLRIYLDICKCLSGRCTEASWDEYSTADWALFEKLVLDEGVAALINNKKSELKPLLEHIPIETWLNFSGMRMRIKYTNELRYRELFENVFPAILPEYKPLVMLKGSALALALYNDISLRNMCDTDLLVSYENLTVIADKLKKTGYKIINESITNPRPYSSILVEDKHLSLRKSGANGILIELHWKLLRRYQQKGYELDNWFLKNLMPIPEDGIFQSIPGLYMLNYTASFIHQVLHVYLCHGKAVSGLFHFYETYFMAKKWNDLIDWDGLSDIFEKLGQIDFLILASDMCEELFGKALPVKNLTNSDRNAFVLKLNSQPIKTPIVKYLYIIKQLPLMQKLKFIFGAVFPSPSFMKKRYDNEKGSLLLLYLRRLSDGLKVLPKFIRTVLTGSS
jgi:hypothetical protein